MLKRVAVVGDIHTEHRVLEAVLTFLEKNSTLDAILSVGDVVDGIGDPNACCALIQQHNVLGVRGNHERWLINDILRDLLYATPKSELTPENFALIESFPSIRTFDTPGGKLMLCHGIGEHDMNRISPDDFGYAIELNLELQQLVQEREFCYIINGHTHLRMVRSFDSLTIINAGTIKRNEQTGFCIIDFEEGWVQFYGVDVQLNITEDDKQLLPNSSIIRQMFIG